jgi:hypothetical protein
MWSPTEATAATYPPTVSPVSGTRLRAAIASAWRGGGGATRTQPIFIASVCSGVLGYTVSAALQVNVLLAYVVTVVVVFAATTAVLVYRDR